MSPSRTAAIGPPRGASGATWPAMKPRVAPLKRPSVSSATESPSPSPDDRGGHAEHLAHARPALGALVADHDHVARLDLLALTAAIASSSDSNTRAGPRCSRRSWPATFTTQPSGARLPCRITRPPVGFERLGERADDLLARGLSARVGLLGDRPAGDRHARPSCSSPASSSRLGDQRHAAGAPHVGAPRSGRRASGRPAAASAR